LLKIFAGPEGRLIVEKFNKAQLPPALFARMKVNDPIPVATDDAAPSLPAYVAGSSSLGPDSNASPNPVFDGGQVRSNSITDKLRDTTAQAEARIGDMDIKRGFATPAQDEFTRKALSSEVSLHDIIRQGRANPNQNIETDLAGNISLHSIIRRGYQYKQRARLPMKRMVGRRPGKIRTGKRRIIRSRSRGAML
jgi:hypothetical protein